MPNYGITLDQAMRIINGLTSRDQIEAEVIGKYAASFDRDAPVDFHIMVDLHEALKQAETKPPRSPLSLFWPREKEGGLIAEQDATASLKALSGVLGEPNNRYMEETEKLNLVDTGGSQP
ncbi:hypothetical protein C8P63_109105 [Melghirimyces profundicolus]|uniref:Uncharacterized protein n=1 Tax=Melghirimyces profundicolus TaxID=1242148 RepID=A0A2T6BW72_9BACL|nr:hypothetical protein [Melghirimyces profundicolus]PTX60340.1 hypothetical protein C8P63_109105 [Melghirimyces profundicolus]